MSIVRLLLLLLATALGTTSARAEPITVSAAISLKPALEQIAADYSKQNKDDTVKFNFGASGQLAAQIRQGAPVDVFISAAQKQVKDLIADGNLLDAASVRVVAGNSLVLVVPADAKDAPKSFEALADPHFARIAIGDPRTVPVGQYAQQALTSLRIFDAIRPRLVLGANVRQTLVYVERGEVSAGIVYVTDALEAADKVKQVAVCDAKLHDPIEYPAARLSKPASSIAAADRFMEYLASEPAQRALASHGFTIPVRTSSPTTRPGHE